MRRAVPLGMLVATAVAYLLAPGPAHMVLNGLPIGQAGIVALVVLIGSWAWIRRAAPATTLVRVATLAALVAVKVVLGAVTPHTGWLARYYANESFAPPVERSIDFRHLDATRIDRRLTLAETEFPVHFFNNRGYNTGVFREWELPFSVQWRGHLHREAGAATPLRLSANGRAALIVNGTPVAEASGAGETAVVETVLDLPPGAHVIEVHYQKPARTAALLRLERVAGGTAVPFLDDQVTPGDAPATAVALAPYARAAAWAVHVAALVIVARGLWPGLRQITFRALPIGPLVVGLLLAQGLWKSQHLVDRVWTLSGGDDWLNYEMAARDAVLNGLMMSEGGVIGRGQPFSLYPGYAYFVALVHAVTGESLAGVVLVNFVLLAAATLVAHRIGLALLGPLGALGGVIWLLLLQQAAFVRYYTVTLFSENLYFLLAAATVLFLIRHVRAGGIRDLAAAAVLGALASWTRPSMMLLLPAAVLIIAAARLRADGWRRTAVAVGAFVVIWMASLAPITIRNYLMSGRAVLITAGQGATFVAYNMPVDDKMYFKGFDGTLFNSALILIRMFVDHPVASLQNYGTKLGFSLGMVHWMGSGTFHPELVATSLLYFAGFVLLRPMRSIAALPLHAFVFTHVATLMLTMPSNYGYRMILPAFVFMSLAAGALAIAPCHRFITGRWPRLGRVMVGSTA